MAIHINYDELRSQLSEAMSSVSSNKGNVEVLRNSIKKTAQIATNAFRALVQPDISIPACAKQFYIDLNNTIKELDRTVTSKHRDRLKTATQAIADSLLSCSPDSVDDTLDKGSLGLEDVQLDERQSALDDSKPSSLYLQTLYQASPQAIKSLVSELKALEISLVMKQNFFLLRKMGTANLSLKELNDLFLDIQNLHTRICAVRNQLRNQICVQLFHSVTSFGKLKKREVENVLNQRMDESKSGMAREGRPIPTLADFIQLAQSLKTLATVSEFDRFFEEHSLARCMQDMSELKEIEKKICILVVKTKNNAFTLPFLEKCRSDALEKYSKLCEKVRLFDSLTDTNSMYSDDVKSLREYVESEEMKVLFTSKNLQHVYNVAVSISRLPTIYERTTLVLEVHELIKMREEYTSLLLGPANFANFKRMDNLQKIGFDASQRLKESLEVMQQSAKNVSEIQFAMLSEEIKNSENLFARKDIGEAIESIIKKESDGFSNQYDKFSRLVDEYQKLMERLMNRKEEKGDYQKLRSIHTTLQAEYSALLKKVDYIEKFKNPELNKAVKLKDVKDFMELHRKELFEMDTDAVIAQLMEYRVKPWNFTSAVVANSMQCVRDSIWSVGRGVKTKATVITQGYQEMSTTKKVSRIVGCAVVGLALLGVRVLAGTRKK